MFPSYATNPADGELGESQEITVISSDNSSAKKAKSNKPDTAAVASATKDDVFLSHYFKRIDPEVVASFTAEQCTAIKAMFGSRGIADHMVEIRRSVPFGRRRIYLVFLLGQERRFFGRLYSEGMMSPAFTALAYVALAALVATPLWIYLSSI